jgi:hypothetical protein
MPPIEIDIIGKGSKTLPLKPLKENEKHNVEGHAVAINQITHGKKGLIKHVELAVDSEPPRRLQYNKTKTGWRTDRASILLSDRTLVYARLTGERNKGRKQ